MSPPLVDRSPDLQRLQNDGYAVEIAGGHLLVHDVPYLDAGRVIRRGTLVSTLTLSGDRTAAPDTHVALFVGTAPCNLDGTEIAAIRHGAANVLVAPGMVATLSFSNKPAGGYPDYYAKMTRYAEIISAPARALDPSVTPRTFRLLPVATEGEVFTYRDTWSSRAGINRISDKVRSRSVGIIGTGGSGAYVLDQVAKMPVAAIHIFDGDRFYQHNAFRSPGAPSAEELEAAPFKVDHFRAIYAKMHRNVIAHPVRIDETNCSLIEALDFVFVCVDRGDVRRFLVEYLGTRGIPFIDVGMGVELVDDKLIGIVRVTTSSDARRDHVRTRVPMNDPIDDGAYERNIQIGSLNMLSAALAVIRWQKLWGIFQDLEREHHTTYTINTNQMTSDEAA